MSDLQLADMDHLRHMLGVSRTHPQGYRNHYVAGEGDVASMERLLAAGLVVKNTRVHPELTGGMPCYHATLLGARFVGLVKLPC